MRDKVREYLDGVKDIANLKQWEIKVSNDLPPEDAWADIDVSENLWVATVRISNSFFDETPQSQRRILAHELTHIHYAPVERLVEHLEGTLGSQAHELLAKVWETEIERAADSISLPLAEMLPLPEFKSTRSRR